MMKHVTTKPSFTYCRFGGSFGDAMTEYVVASIIAEERRFKLMYKEQEKAIW